MYRWQGKNLFLQSLFFGVSYPRRKSILSILVLSFDESFLFFVKFSQQILTKNIVLVIILSLLSKNSMVTVSSTVFLIFAPASVTVLPALLTADAKKLPMVRAPCMAFACTSSSSSTIRNSYNYTIKIYNSLKSWNAEIMTKFNLNNPISSLETQYTRSSSFGSFGTFFGSCFNHLFVIGSRFNNFFLGLFRLLIIFLLLCQPTAHLAFHAAKQVAFRLLTFQIGRFRCN